LIVPSPDDRLAWRAEIAELRRTGHQTSQVSRRRKNGETIWVDLVASTVTDADGNASGFIAIHRDTTERLRHQQALRESGVRLRNLASRLMAIREQERAALARDLHDQLGQSLTRLQIDLCWLTEQLPRRLQTPRSRGMIALTGTILQTVQHISSELRPPILDDFGLEAAIEWQVREFAEWSHCRCDLDLQLRQLHFDRERDTAVFRIIQEALTNVARHARADVVTVSGQLADGDIIVRVDDNGIGLPGDCLTSSASLGLIGMRERAESVGGSVGFANSPGGGTAVQIVIPIVQDIRKDSHDPALHC
jgi:two-component system, NarL family, sensor histidine kinase UhpB